MVWRRVLVRDTCTLRELHGVIQVAMGWEANQDVTFLTDGGEKVRAPTELVTPEAEHARTGSTSQCA